MWRAAATTTTLDPRSDPTRLWSADNGYCRPPPTPPPTLRRGGGGARGMRNKDRDGMYIRKLIFQGSIDRMEGRFALRKEHRQNSRLGRRGASERFSLLAVSQSIRFQRFARFVPLKFSHKFRLLYHCARCEEFDRISNGSAEARMRSFLFTRPQVRSDSVQTRSGSLFAYDHCRRDCFRTH